MAVAIAYALTAMGYPRRALCYLIQWRFGLRPGEVVQIMGEHFYIRARVRHLGAMSFLRLGVRSGTKVRRPQIARAREEDPIAAWLLELAAAFTQVGERISDMVTYSQYRRVFDAALRWLGLPPDWTPHGLRAGFASWRFASGQQFAELREDGRWVSDASLRIYLDTIAVMDTMSHPLVAPKASLWQNWDASLFSWLPAALRR